MTLPVRPARPERREARRYERTGVLAIDPTAFLELFFVGSSAPPNEETPEATIVTIRGPLDQHDEGWCDSYEAISARVAAACESPAPAIVLKLDSPGGEAQGCFEGAREVKAMCAAAGKQLVAYVEGKAASAAYAYACGASRIVMSDSALVGSIGVLMTRPDYSVQNAVRGYRMGFIASGARKTDGHPDSPITDDELQAGQAIVDSMAGTFFEHVAECRGLSVEQIAALQAGVFHGDDARSSGLGDETLTLKATLASLASWKGQSEMTVKLKAESGDDKDKKPKEGEGEEKAPFDDVRTRLTEMSKGDDANARAAARALAALDKDEEPEAEAPEEKPEAAAAAASSTPEIESIRKLALAAEARAAKLEAKLAKRDEDAEREALIAQHPSLPKTMVALLQKSPLSLVRDTLKDFEPEAPSPEAKPKPKGGASAAASLAAQQPDTKGVRGDNQNGNASGLPPDEKAALDRRFGLRADGGPKAGNIDATSPFKLTLGGAVHKPLAGSEVAVDGKPAA